MSLTKIDDFVGEFDFLSNFYPVNIRYDGMTYPSTEHAYQAHKTLDKELRKKIRDAPNAGSAKRLGRKIALRPGWDGMKLEIMRELVHIKFQDPTLREKLLATGRAQLIEGNSWKDRFWGVYEGKGKNWLGRLLMEEREAYFHFLRLIFI